MTYKMIDFLGIKGKKLNIVPTTKGLNLTELHAKNELMDKSYMGAIAWCKEWKKYVLVDLDKDHMMSLECLKEAFEMTQEYWKNDSRLS